jgi:SAM-dependent methyltransferase
MEPQKPSAEPAPPAGSLARAIFLEAHSGLPREAPGSLASSARALAIAQHDRDGAPIRQVLDAACGPGMQTLTLARLLPDARILAFDLHAPFLQELMTRAHAAGIAARVAAVRADLGRPPFVSGAFDLVWCEGGAYLIGVQRALGVWRGLLAAGGYVAFTDAVWLRPHVPEPVRSFWRAYPGMQDMDGVRATIARAGLRPAGDFVLPESDWWEYYDPLAQRIAELRERYRGDAQAGAALDACATEIELYRRHADCYGYAFFVAAA